MYLSFTLCTLLARSLLLCLWPLAAATSVNMPHCQLLVSTATEKEQKIKISQVRKA